MNADKLNNVQFSSSPPYPRRAGLLSSKKYKKMFKYKRKYMILTFKKKVQRTDIVIDIKMKEEFKVQRTETLFFILRCAAP